MTLQDRLNELSHNHIPNYDDGIAKVSLYDLKTGESAELRADDPGWVASIIKVPVMTAVLQKVDQNVLNLHDLLTVDHRLKLESGDYISRLPQGKKIPVSECMYRMIVESDNEATNMLIEAIGGVEEFNDHMWSLDMNQSMLGHLLCYGVPRYTSDFNPDGSNITTPNDMVKILRHIYDDNDFSQLSEVVRVNADTVMEHTNPPLMSRSTGLRIKMKLGYISCPDDGSDIHEIGIANDQVIFAIMSNKVGKKRREVSLSNISFDEHFLSDGFNDVKLSNIVGAGKDMFLEVYQLMKDPLQLDNLGEINPLGKSSSRRDIFTDVYQLIGDHIKSQTRCYGPHKP